jgi:hypothetical protein
MISLQQFGEFGDDTIPYWDTAQPEVIRIHTYLGEVLNPDSFSSDAGPMTKARYLAPADFKILIQ